MSFRKAERKQAKLRLALAGPSGSGKTMSALRIAKGMKEAMGNGCRIGVIDTEKGSSELYAHVVPFDVLQFNPPYPPSKYVAGIKLAEKEGIGILILDSLSHEWSGEGGVLEMVDRIVLADPRKNSYTAWNKVTPEHMKVIEAILQSSMHVIATMRTKVAYDMIKDEKTGKVKPVKVGLAPVQREGTDYEFTTMLDLAVDTHLATSSKDRTELFQVPELLSEETGQRLVEWLTLGA
jgi:ABC-type dipeptide/oligopeptide/nickel transport system ATPase component